MFELPVAQGLFVCDLAITDATTQNLSVINQFTTLKSNRFPTGPRKFSVVAVLVNGFGDFLVRVEILNLGTNLPVFEVSVPLRIPDRLMEVRFVYNITEFVFPAEGRYEATLFVGDEPIARKRFRLTLG